MGELLTTLRVGGQNRQIRLVKRTLTKGGRSFTMRQALRLTGGLILGEGDTGKSTYARMLAELAKEKGPVELIPLRRRSATASLPPVRDGETATIIFDGLDEYPESARDILDFAESLDPDRFHIWVTSRACDAASRLAESMRFEQIYRLSAMTRDDIIGIAEAAGLDGYDFLEAVERLGAGGFLDKPGGAILLLQLFANGGLDGSRATDVMETTALAFAAETRDGHTLSAQSLAIPPERLVDAASWIAAALQIGEWAAIWLGAKTECPKEDLAFDDLPLCDFTREELAEALGRRLFEPLTPERLRLSYSRMPMYLAGRWISRRVPKEKVAAFDIYSIAAAAAIKPEVGLDFVGRHPDAFLGCHGLIRKFGFKPMLDAILSRRDESDRYVYSNFGELSGMDDFAEYLLGIVESRKFSAKHLDVLSRMLSGCRPKDIERSVSAIVDALLCNRKITAWALYYVCRSLVDTCGTERPKVLDRLRPLYERYGRLCEEDRPDACYELMKLFDYPGWLIAKKRGLVGEPLWSGVHSRDDGEEIVDVPTESEVERFLAGEPSIEDLEWLINVEGLRGLRYGALRRHFDAVFSLSSEELLDSPQMFGCAVAYDPVRGLQLIISLMPERWSVNLRWTADDESEDIIDKCETLIRVLEIAYGIRSFSPDSLNLDACRRLYGLLHDFGRSPLKNFTGDVHDRIDQLDDTEEGDGAVSELDKLRELSDACRIKSEPVAAKVVAVEGSVKEELGEALAQKVKNKGGRPRKKDRAADAMTQAQVAEMFNLACGGDEVNKDKVSNWESYQRTEGRRGSTPPEGEYNGRLVVYTVDLREHPTPENKAILAAIIERFRSTRAVKDGIRNAQKIRCKSEESLFRARGGMQAELARRRENL